MVTKQRSFRLSGEETELLSRVFMFADVAWRASQLVGEQAGLGAEPPFGELWQTVEEQLRWQGVEERPVVVCLCGSTRFWREFQAASLRETLAGRIVLSIGAASGTDDEHFGNLPPEEYKRVKAELDDLHLRKIDLADEVLILNKGGYIGPSTSRELEYAQGLGKRVRFLEAS